MEIDSEASDSYLVIITRRDRVKVFCKIYWRSLLFIIVPIVWLPIAFIGDSYVCLFVFLVSCCYWILDVLHPGVTALLPIALFSLIDYWYKNFISEVHIHNGVLNCLGVMMIIIAIEHSRVHMRVAVKLLLVFGCSHYKLSFLLFFTCMFLSMWVSNTLACGLMIPIVKAILYELEKMGILEVYHNIGTAGVRQKTVRHEEAKPRPTDFTVFYFLGIAYSSSIGGMTSLIGTQSNQILKYYSEQIFPEAPKIVFPNFILLTLPGVLLMEAMLYLWLNFYFMGMFRAQSEIALEIGMTEEEAEYIQTLLIRQYNQLGKIKFHEIITSVLVFLTIIFQATRTEIYGHITLWSPGIVCALLFFVVPVDLNFIKFFKKQSSLNEEPFPTKPSKACLSWSLVSKQIHWSVLFVIGGSCAMMEVLRMSGVTDDFGRFLLLTKDWPAPAIAVVVILFCKILTEFAPNSCVLYNLMPSIVQLSLISRVNPHYLMSAATLSCTMPFLLIPGTAANTLVVHYVHIPPWKMMRCGLGPTVASIVIVWITCTLWARVLWPDLNSYPNWAEVNIYFAAMQREKHDPKSLEDMLVNKKRSFSDP